MEDFIQDCCSRRESWGSTHDTTDSWKFIDNKQSKGINRWKITKRRHLGKGLNWPNQILAKVGLRA